MKCGNIVFVSFAVFKLLLDLRDGRVSAFVEPRRQLCRTRFSHVAVFELAIAQKAYLIAADGAFFVVEEFSKQSHSPSSLLSAAPKRCGTAAAAREGLPAFAARMMVVA